MKITYYGTSASEAWPALFCNCEACELARQLGGKNIRTRSQALVDTTLLLDFPPDTNYHAQQYHLDLRKVETLLITHSHHDHFFPYDICMRTENYATGLSDKKLTVYGNEEVESRFCQAARIDGSVSKFVRFQRLEPFDCVNTEDGYEITAVLADHNQPEKSLLYLIKKGGKQLLYAHDTGIFPEVTWKFLEGKRFDFVSLDCTALTRDWKKGHMGFEAVDQVRDRMTEMKCIDTKTTWASELNNAALGVIKDSDDKLYALMTTGSCLGTAVNMNVCEAAGVDPWAIETWEDFNAACDKIKAAGYTPVANYFTSAGALANANGSWLSYEGEQFNDNEAMLNGTWDWQNFGVILDYLQTWFDNGYLYEDCGTIKQADVIERCAQNECAFVVGIGTSFQTAVVAQNPEVKMAMIPICASKEGGARFCGIGEGASFGIWKDTDEMEVCKAFLNYVSQNADGINAAAGEISTLPCETTKSYGMQLMEEMESHYPDVFYDNLWDRKYMPSGMWSVFQVAAGMFCEDQSDESKAEVIEYLKENYTDLYEAAQE